PFVKYDEERGLICE
ncbi:TPA: DUF5511 family protein, partial [Bacillus toyonensis]|nr:DUF5511 family protein [Bacillus toyonensis]